MNSSNPTDSFTNLEPRTTSVDGSYEFQKCQTLHNCVRASTYPYYYLFHSRFMNFKIFLFWFSLFILQRCRIQIAHFFHMSSSFRSKLYFYFRTSPMNDLLLFAYSLEYRDFLLLFFSKKTLSGTVGNERNI